MTGPTKEEWQTRAVIWSAKGAAVSAERRHRRSAETQVLHSQGLSISEIASRVGVSRAAVRGYLYDPDGSKQKEARDKFHGKPTLRQCGCGATDAGPGGLCRACRYESMRRQGWVVEDRGYSSPCWIWQGCINKKGYGTARIDGFLWYAHRLTYERRVGKIPRGLTTYHLCLQKSCVNPDHIELLTRSEGTRRTRPWTLR